MTTCWPIRSGRHLQSVAQHAARRVDDQSAAEAGKAILCEKPLAVTADEAERMAETCARLGMPLMEAFMYRFHRRTARVRALLARGAIGEVREVRASLSVRLMDPPDPTNVRLQPDSAAARCWIWAATRSMRRGCSSAKNRAAS